MGKRTNLKNEIIEALEHILSASQNLEHTRGTTQTTTNMLYAKFSDKGQEVERTTRYIHQQQVADQSKKIIEETLPDGPEKEYLITLAGVAGYIHDIGHCTYGHDGEDTINKFNQSFTGSLSEERRKQIKEFRDTYFSGTSTEHSTKTGYESQQDWQNTLIDQEYKGNSLIFDHGEESALAIINICQDALQSNSEIAKIKSNPEYQDIFESVFNEVQNDLVQCALMHSRPAFEKSNAASEAVAISDSVAFIQDDLDQALLASRNLGGVPEEICNTYKQERLSAMTETLGLTPEEMASEFGLNNSTNTFTDFLSKDSEDRKSAVTQEIAKRYQAQINAGVKNPKIQNGKHYDDLIWYAGKVPNDEKISNEEFLKRQIEILEKGGYNPADNNDKWSQLCTKKIEAFKGGSVQKKDFANQVKVLLELKYRKEFPVSYDCYCINSAIIQNKLIYANNLGNNTTKDGASTKFMLLRLYKGFINQTYGSYDEKKKDNKTGLTSEQAATQTISFEDFFEQIRKTPEFKKLKENISSGKEFKGLSSGAFDSSDEREQDLQVFRRLGFNITKMPDKNDKNNILNRYSPVQLISKMVEGMTNEFSRTYTRDLTKDMHISNLYSMGMLDTKGTTGNLVADGRHLTPQDLLGLGYPLQHIQAFEESIKKKPILVNGEKQEDGFTKIKVWDDEFEAISYGVEKFDKDARMQFGTLSTEMTDPKFKEILDYFNKVDGMITSGKNGEQQLTEAQITRLKRVRHKLSFELSRRIGVENHAVDKKEPSKQEGANEPTKKAHFKETVDELLQDLENGELANNPYVVLDNIIYLVSKSGISEEEIKKLKAQLDKTVQQIIEIQSNKDKKEQKKREEQTAGLQIEERGNG